MFDDIVAALSRYDVVLEPDEGIASFLTEKSPLAEYLTDGLERMKKKRQETG